MKREIILCQSQGDYDRARDLLGQGWEFDLRVSDHPMHLDAGHVFALVLYESDAERPKPVEERKPGEFDDVVDVKSVEFPEVEAFVKQGYVVQSLYAKNVLMIKRKLVGEAEAR